MVVEEHVLVAADVAQVVDEAHGTIQDRIEVLCRYTMTHIASSSTETITIGQWLAGAGGPFALLCENLPRRG